MADSRTGQIDRAAAARRGHQLELLTLLWGATEASLSLAAAARSGSLSLAGFGFDSTVEVISAAALMWRMAHEMNDRKREEAERRSLRIAGSCLLALAAYVLIDSVMGLRHGHEAQSDWLGIAITLAALICMPLLARAKRKVGRALSSRAMMTDATQTDFCMYQAAIVLLGLLVHRTFGIAWTDNVAALLLVPLLVWTGVRSLRGENSCSC